MRWNLDSAWQPPLLVLYICCRYDWYKEKGGEKTLVDPSKDSRYTLINGRLIIDNPIESWDSAAYECTAENDYGKIISRKVNLEFGCK